MIHEKQSKKEKKSKYLHKQEISDKLSTLSSKILGTEYNTNICSAFDDTKQEIH